MIQPRAAFYHLPSMTNCILPRTLCLALALLPHDGPAQEANAARRELSALRGEHELALLRATTPALRDYAMELTSMEKRLAAARDLDGAITVRDERLAMEKEIARMEKEDLLLIARQGSLRAALAPEQIVLMPDQATLSGVEREPGTGALTAWAKPGAAASWKLPNLPPGGYEVVLRYTSDALEGGTLMAAEQRFTLTSSIDTTLKGPAEKSIGTLKITNGSGSLTLTAKSVVKTNLMRLHFVKLLPASR